MKKILSITGAMFAVMLIGSTPAMAQHCGGGCMGGGHGEKHEGKHGKGGMMGPGFWKNPEVAKQLTLTDVQIKKIEAIHENAKKTGEAVHKEMKELKGTMKEAFKASPVDVAKVKAIAEKISAKKSAMFLMHVQMKAETMNVLTAQQKAKLFEMKPGKDGEMKGCDCDKDGGCKCDKAAGGCKCGEAGGCPMMDDDDDDDGDD